MNKNNLTKIILLHIILTIFINTPTAHNHQQLPDTTGDGTLRRIHVPILMYHYVSELPPNADDIRTRLTVSPQRFRAHIQYLQSQGYNTISLYEIDLALENGTPLPSNPVVLTFDDGYIDHYATVFPILQEYGFTGTFFVVSEFADNNRPRYMSWEQITEMANAGMSIESHTKTHADLRERNYDFLIYEILGSAESIAYYTGVEPRILAYPIGRYDDNALNVLSTTRILRAVTTEIGAYHTTDNRLLLSRMRITNETGVSGLQYLLNYER
ncbi:MAG: polysaccharide deacetylase family protein [Anaerolineae bacterium]|nr:polysaccharide deacetylase family protein [Anaerolineae bacterium]MDQ7035458.1 polysaccharide deacetylase family protein [Anaerolineae bacterium]